MGKYYRQIELESKYFVDIVIKRIIKMFNFELREIARFLSQVKAAVYEPTHGSDKYKFVFPEEKGESIIMTYIVPLLIGLKIADISKYDDFVNGKDVEPLKNLFDLNDDYSVLEDMLDNNESFEKVDKKKLVIQEDVIKRFYDAIFVTQYTSSKYHTVLGKYKFSEKSKSFALNTSNMMSNFAVLS